MDSHASSVRDSELDPVAATMTKTFFDMSISSAQLLEEGELISTCERVYPAPEHQAGTKTKKKFRFFGWLGIYPKESQPKKKYEENMNAHLDRVNRMDKKRDKFNRGSGDAARLRALV